jgi:hypothetical protein
MADFNLEETGINPVKTDSGSSDIYFTNQDYSKKYKSDKTTIQNSSALLKSQREKIITALRPLTCSLS